jgi:hypothetical protein
MRNGTALAVLLLAALGLGGCGARDDAAPEATPASDTAGSTSADGAAAMPPFRPVASTAVLMRGTVSMAAEDYWKSVSIVIDLEGEHHNFPQDEAEWERVWAAGITLAETGNLLLMPPRAIDDPEWTRLSLEMIEVGLNAARAADAQDYMGVLDEGEKVYNLCTECHQIFYPSLQL